MTDTASSVWSSSYNSPCFPRNDSHATGDGPYSRLSLASSPVFGTSAGSAAGAMPRANDAAAGFAYVPQPLAISDPYRGKRKPLVSPISSHSGHSFMQKRNKNAPASQQSFGFSPVKRFSFQHSNWNQAAASPPRPFSLDEEKPRPLPQLQLDLPKDDNCLSAQFELLNFGQNVPGRLGSSSVPASPTALSRAPSHFSFDSPATLPRRVVVPAADNDDPYLGEVDSPPSSPPSGSASSENTPFIQDHRRIAVEMGLKYFSPSTPTLTPRSSAMSRRRHSANSRISALHQSFGSEFRSGSENISLTGDSWMWGRHSCAIGSSSPASGVSVLSFAPAPLNVSSDMMSPSMTSPANSGVESGLPTSRGPSSQMGTVMPSPETAMVSSPDAVFFTSLEGSPFSLSAAALQQTSPVTPSSSRGHSSSAYVPPGCVTVDHFS